MRQLDLGGGPVEDVLRWARHRSEAILEELGGDPEAVLDAMLAGLGQGEFPILDGSGAVPASAVVESLALAEEAALAESSIGEISASPPTQIADSGVALRVLAELGEGELPAGAAAEVAAEVHEGEALDDDLDPLAGLVDDDELPLISAEPLAASLGPPLPPGLPEPDEVASVTDDDGANLPLVTDDDEASLPRIVDDEGSLSPVTDDDEASLPPVTDDDDATPLAAAAPAPSASLDDDLGPPLLPGLDEPTPHDPALTDEAPLDLGPPLLPGFESDALGPPPAQEPSGVHELPGPAPDDRWSGESDWSERSFLLGIPDDETLAAAAAEIRRGREDDAPVARRRDASSRSSRAASGRLDAAPPPLPAEPASSATKDKPDKPGKSGKAAKKEKKSKKKSQGVVVLDKTVRRSRPRTDSAPAAGEDAVEEIDEFEEIDDVELLDE